MFEETNSHQIVFKKIDGGVGKEYGVSKVESFGKGMESVKWFVEINMGMKKIRMLLRDFEVSYTGRAVELVKEYMEKYRAFKSIGLPVPETIRVSEDGKKILMSDVTNSGENFIIDTLHNKERVREITNLKDVSDQVSSISKRALEAGYVIRDSGYCVVVNKKSGVAQVMLLDLGDGVDSKVKVSKYLENAEQSEVKMDEDEWMQHKAKNECSAFLYFLGWHRN
ncbi:hypothetical protein A2572_03140 [Candidatus Collierbacteria bacterium RIFOXYD1_FULL_40_9]|uniref:Uncharacterized protein n=1 Tax=Candidatus Collierbacteria bacterium RIFOXYD1_FULL_40_9 TaxID=1817731 RepID=A0A1F5FWW2_9BACT|nr:MAG: hypothetical protein A2572_03140 [Candidatus Collierbacteria bacterium RIFOXYD1_FULL_40_9]